MVHGDARLRRGGQHQGDLKELLLTGEPSGTEVLSQALRSASLAASSSSQFTKPRLKQNRSGTISWSIPAFRTMEPLMCMDETAA